MSAQQSAKCVCSAEISTDNRALFNRWFNRHERCYARDHPNGPIGAPKEATDRPPDSDVAPLPPPPPPNPDLHLIGLIEKPATP